MCTYYIEVFKAVVYTPENNYTFDTLIFRFTNMEAVFKVKKDKMSKETFQT